MFDLLYNVAMEIVLASGSPRRKELLKKVFPTFSVISSHDPEVSAEKDPRRLVIDLARHKARDVWKSNRDSVVVGADTVVDFNGEILGKPKSRDEARQMLKTLSGRVHCVRTGVCVIFNGVAARREIPPDIGVTENAEGATEIAFCETSFVTFRWLSDTEIDLYVESGAPMDKAGAYGIQECGFVDSYTGSYDNIVGLPTERLKHALSAFFDLSCAVVR